MTTKEELLNQRQLVDNNGHTIITLRTGPNRAERRRNAARAKAKPKKATVQKRRKPKKAKVRPAKHKATSRRRIARG